MATVGNATLDFGTTKNGTASVAVTGQSAILSTSQVEAFIVDDVVADPNGHSADEHIVENLKFVCGNIVVGTGFTIYAECTVGTTTGQFKVRWVWSN